MEGDDKKWGLRWGRWRIDCIDLKCEINDEVNIQTQNKTDKLRYNDSQKGLFNLLTSS